MSKTLSTASKYLGTLFFILSFPFISTASDAAEQSMVELLDITTPSLEELAQTEVVSAAHFAQQVVDAPSAVSVVTDEDIHRFGYRTIGEILDSMRGIHITRDRDFDYLGGRGYGAPKEYAGRIMILIDGYAAADNLYNQVFTGPEGYLDTSLIERVEYAPGPGSAIYGNNAFLGVINIITKQGRDFDGTVATLTRGSQNDEEATITWGKRFDTGAEWLLSASTQNTDGIHRYYDGEVNNEAARGNNRLFLKGNLGKWSIEAASADGWANHSLWNSEGLGRVENHNRFVNIVYESDLQRDWRTTTRFYHADYRYIEDVNAIDYDERFVYQSYGRWYGIDSKLIYLGLEGHRILLGSEYRVDSQFDITDDIYTPGKPLEEYNLEGNGDTLSVYAEDSLSLTQTLSASIGGRYDRRRYLSLDTKQSTFSPRLALIYTPKSDLSVKLSYGHANRFTPPAETFGDAPPPPSRVRTIELVVEHAKDDYRLLGSLYRYRVEQLDPYDDTEYQEIVGAELESEWQWSGGETLRASYTWQQARDDRGNDMPNVPQGVGKLQYSIPLVGEKLRASMALRYIGTRAKLNDNGYADSFTVTDLTLKSSKVLPHTTLTFAVRNMFDTHYSEVAIGADNGLQAQAGRTLWLQAEYKF